MEKNFRVENVGVNPGQVTTPVPSTTRQPVPIVLKNHIKRGKFSTSNLFYNTTSYLMAEEDWRWSRPVYFQIRESLWSTDEKPFLVRCPLAAPRPSIGITRGKGQGACPGRKLEKECIWADFQIIWNLSVFLIASKTFHQSTWNRVVGFVLIIIIKYQQSYWVI